MFQKNTDFLPAKMFWKLMTPANVCAILLLLFLFNIPQVFAQKTPYERNGKNYTATYSECIEFYKTLDEQFETVSMVEMGMSDAGLPLQVVLINAQGEFNPDTWHRQHEVVILINNGIHPGEPDGIDASMLWVRDLAMHNKIPAQVSIAIIPVYNIGGCLNRSAFNRVDQNGPEAFGSRGNSQNLDLNRDFIKCDSKEARAFAEIFQWINPTIFLDNHVSDGADYPYVMTLATSQYNKLGGEMGTYLHEIFELELYKEMSKQNFPMIPYVNVWGHDASEGWAQFFDSPRYSTGYATLFHTFGFTPETHMLKPYPLRVEATYRFMQTIANYASLHAEELLQIRKRSIENAQKQSLFPLQWKLDENSFTEKEFNGYTYKTKTSAVSGLPVKYYDRNAPYTKKIKFRNTYNPTVQVEAPLAYIIPQGWWKVIELLQLNGVSMQRLKHDSIMDVEAYKITDFKSSERAYEGHHGNSTIGVEKQQMNYAFRKGDYIIPLSQDRKRFIIEVLEPQGSDSYLAWNFFDAILVQKEGYSDYAYEEFAAQYLSEHPDLKAKLMEKREADSSFANNASAQLDFVFKHSPYYEKGHNLYPVFRLAKSGFLPGKIENSKGIEYRNKNDE